MSSASKKRVKELQAEKKKAREEFLDKRKEEMEKIRSLQGKDITIPGFSYPRPVRKFKKGKVVKKLIPDDEEEEGEGEEETEFEEYISYEYQNEKIFQGYLQDIATRLGLPLRELRLVGTLIRQPIYETEMQKETDTVVRVGPFGSVVPVTELPSINPKVTPYNPEEIEVGGEMQKVGPAETHHYNSYTPETKTVANPYHPDYPLGSRVEFQGTPQVSILQQPTEEALGKPRARHYLDEGVVIRGLVVNFDPTYLHVFDQEVIYLVPYNTPQLRRIKRATRPKVPIQLEVIDFLHLLNQPVPPELRQWFVEYYTELLTDLRPLKKEEAAPPPPPFILKSWGDYYAENLHNWFYHQKYQKLCDDVLNDAPLMDRLQKEAVSIVQYQTSGDRFIEVIRALLPQGFTSETTNLDIVQALKGKKDLSLIEARLLTGLEKMQ